MNALAPEFSALIIIFGSAGPVISTRRSSRSAGAPVTVQSAARTLAVSARKSGIAPHSISRCRRARRSSRLRRWTPNSRSRRATKATAASVRTASSPETLPRTSSIPSSDVSVIGSHPDRGHARRAAGLILVAGSATGANRADKPSVDILDRHRPWLRHNLPRAVDARAAKKFGFAAARLASVRLDTPIATTPHALPSATSNRNMLAPSWRAEAMRSPEASSTTTVSGGTVSVAA